MLPEFSEAKAGHKCDESIAKHTFNLRYMISIFSISQPESNVPTHPRKQIKAVHKFKLLLTPLPILLQNPLITLIVSPLGGNKIVNCLGKPARGLKKQYINI